MAVSLQKGQKVSLKKDLNGGKDLVKVRLGLGWDITPSAGQVDLDAGAVLLDANKAVVDTVYFRSLRSKCGSVVHSGDNLTGAGDGDDEVITVDLSKVPANVQHIVFTVNSFRGQKFTVVQNAFVRLVDDANNNELGRYALSVGFDKTGLVMGRLYRHNGEWKFSAMGDAEDGRTVVDLVTFIQRLF